MRFIKYLFMMALSSVLVEATDHLSMTTSKETSRQIATTAFAAVYTHETSRATLQHSDYKNGGGQKDYEKIKTTYTDGDDIKTTYKYEDNYHDSITITHRTEATRSTKTVNDMKETHTTKATHGTNMTHETTKKHSEYHKATQTTSLTSMKSHTEYHNTSTVLMISTGHMMTSIATSTAIYSATHTEESTHMVSVSKMMDTTSLMTTLNIFSMTPCTSCITDIPMTGLLTAPLSSQTTTPQLYMTSMAYTAAAATPTVEMQSTMLTHVTTAAVSSPSAGLATTSRAVFTGSGDRQAVSYSSMALAFLAPVCTFIWF